jgi:hypothetical protein
MASISWSPAACLLCAGIVWLTPTAGAMAEDLQTECEEGIRFIRESLARSTDPAQRAALTEALRDAEREAGEREYDECLEAIEDAKIAVGGKQASQERVRKAPEHLEADEGLPVSVEDAFVPRPGEVEAKAGFVYDRVRRRTSGDEDEPRRSGRNRYTPRVELEAGILPGLAATIGGEYRFGDADETKNGEVEVGAKWNFLGAQGWWPALALSAGVALPYGYDNDTTETTLALLGSLPLGQGTDVPWLHANVAWSRAFNIEEDEERRDRYSAVLGLAVPVARSTGLIFDLVREQESEKHRYNNLVEAGVRHVLPGEFVLAGGAGVGFGNSETDFRLLVGLQKSF